jgi:hypothetical protein
MPKITLEEINANDVVSEVPLNANFTALANLLNGNLDEDNVGYLGAESHGDRTAETVPYHSTESIVLTNTAGYFDGTTAEDALNEIAEELDGIVADSGFVPVLIGSKHDDTVATTTGAVIFAGCDIVVPANAAPNGIMVIMSAEGGNGGLAGSVVAIPIRINSTDLSSYTGGLYPNIVTQPRWHLVWLLTTSYLFPALNTQTLHATYTPDDGWNPAIENTVRVGTTTIGAAGDQINGCTLSVFALKSL